MQVLWDSESLHNTFYSTTNDITSTAGCGGTTTGAQCANNIGLGVPVYIDSLTWTCQATSAAFTAPGPQRSFALRHAVLLPKHDEPYGSVRSDPRRDTTWNNQEVVKLQYTHNMGSNAFFRVYGYTYYSDWLQNGPQTTYADFSGCCSPDYEFRRNSRLKRADSRSDNAQNLVSLQASYVTANSIRDNNSFYAAGGLWRSS